MPFTFYPSKKEVNKRTESRCTSVDILKRFVTWDKSLNSDLLQNSPVGLPVGCHYNNGLIGAVQDAYNHHYRLVLRPDDFWIAILVQFSYYVNRHSEELRNKLVNFEGKQELSITVQGSLRTVDYGEIELLSKEVDKALKSSGVREWIRPDFTTTTQTDQVVSSVILMSAMQNYFNYSCVLLCGLPEVTVLGEAMDYRDLQKKVIGLLDYDVDGSIKKWVDMLLLVTHELKCAVEGRPDLDFWNKICHYKSQGSGPAQLSGWITCFNVFNSEGEWIPNRYVQERNIKGVAFPSLTTNDVQTGLATVPLHIDDNGVSYSSKMFAGSCCYDVVRSHPFSPIATTKRIPATPPRSLPSNDGAPEVVTAAEGPPTQRYDWLPTHPVRGPPPITAAYVPVPRWPKQPCKPSRAFLPPAEAAEYQGAAGTQEPRRYRVGDGAAFAEAWE